MPEMVPVMLAHTMAELTKNPSTHVVARRMIRRFRIVVPPKTSWFPRNYLEMASAPPTVLLDFSFIKFIEIGFTFSIALLSSRIIEANHQSRGNQAYECPTARFPGEFAAGSSAKISRDALCDDEWL